MNGLNQDLRHGMRRFRKSPGFTFVAVVTLALAIGATTAIFSVVYGVLLRSLPYADPNRIMAIFEVNSRGAWNRLADPNFDDFRDQNHSFQAIAKYGDGIASVSGASLPTRSMVASVSPDFFNVFRVHPMIGRDFSAMDTRKGAVSVALVSYGYWKQYLGSSLDLSHSHLKIDNSVYSVIGVLPEGFLFPPEAVLWVPADLDGENPSRTSHNYSAVGPVSVASLSRQFDVLFAQKERIGKADFCVATDGYFQALGIRLLRGRSFGERDGAGSPHVAVISDSLARERWPGQDPIGHTIEFGNMDGDVRLLTIVGIVGDVHEYGLDAPPHPTVYVDLFQRPRSTMTVTMLSDADAELVTSAALGILRELNPEIPPRFRTFSQVYSASLGSRRFNVILIGLFGIVALLLATAGVFGVMAYSVSQRTREIGVRVALGARKIDVLTMISSEGLRTVFVGIAIGVAGSLALTRTVESLLFGVTATDPLTFAAVILLLIATALLACYIPARRATKVDPMVALRYE